jgi:N-methylhydantoinase B
MDSGGAGFHRGGNAVHKKYRFEVDGEIAIHDDRERSAPWGVLGGEPGALSTKTLHRVDGGIEQLPSKISQIPVRKGDVLVYHTAGGGGWKDPLERPAEKVRLDVIRGLVSMEKADRAYGVVLDRETMQVDETATAARREAIRASRLPIETFTLGPVPEPIGIQRRAIAQKPTAELKIAQAAD